MQNDIFVVPQNAAKKVQLVNGATDSVPTISYAPAATAQNGFQGTPNADGSVTFKPVPNTTGLQFSADATITYPGMPAKVITLIVGSPVQVVPGDGGVVLG